MTEDFSLARHILRGGDYALSICWKTEFGEWRVKMKITFAAIFLFQLGAVAAYGQQPSNATPEVLARGKIVFTQNCVICHGDHGLGDGPAAASLNPKPRNFIKDKFKQGTSVKDIFTTVTGGIAGSAMAGFSSMPEQDRWAVTHYISNLRETAK